MRTNAHIASTRAAGLAAAAALAGLAPLAAAQETVTLFGQAYRVQRFDYSQQIQIPSIAFPGLVNGMVEVEGFHYVGARRFLMSSDALGEVFPGEPKNWVIEAELVEDAGGNVTGLSFVRLVVASDFTLDGFELDPSGITVNPTASGIGGGGNLVIGSSQESIRAYNLGNPGVRGTALPVPPGSSCQPANCQLNLVGQLFDLEDIAFVPAFGRTNAQFYVLNQEFPSSLRRYTLDGTFVSEFNIGRDGPQGDALMTPKGLTYLADSERFPATIRRPGGALMVGLDNDFPGLQVFSREGALVAYEPLTQDGTALGAPKLATGDCGLQIESVGADPVTGRLFLINQGDGLTCNFIWILTPITGTTCAPDYNGDGALNTDDISDYITDYFADPVTPGPGGYAQPCPGAPAPYDTLGYRVDFNQDCAVNTDDISDYITAYFAGC